MAAATSPLPAVTYEDLRRVADGELGVHEAPGDANTARILEYQRTTASGRAWLLRDSVPWCSSFVNWCVAQLGLVGTGDAAARSWLRWGQQCALEEAWIVVFSRPPKPWAGHVAIPVRGLHTPQMLTVVGGNQRNRVCVAQYPRARLIGCRRPASSTQ